MLQQKQQQPGDRTILQTGKPSPLSFSFFSFLSLKAQTSSQGKSQDQPTHTEKKNKTLPNFAISCKLLLSLSLPLAISLLQSPGVSLLERGRV
jgi:hypothetical protein